MTRYCRNCGKSMKDTELECPACGEKYVLTDIQKSECEGGSSALLTVTQILSGIWVIAAIAVAIILVAGAKWMDEDWFLITGAALGGLFLLSAVISGIATLKIKKRKGCISTMVLLIVAGLVCLNPICAVMGFVTAVMTLICSKEFR